MTKSISENAFHRGQGGPHTPTAAVSDERTVTTGERSGNDSPARSILKQNQAPVAGTTAQGGYGSPSPPPPAPASLSSLASQTVSYEPQNEQRMGRSGDIQHSSYGAYPTSRGAAAGTPAITPWSSNIHGALESNMAYSLERIHATSLALYNYACEHLERQIPTVPDELYGLLPIAAEIGQELRSLLAMHEGRPARESGEMAPYYPWASGNSAAPPYWMPSGRDERENKSLRGEEGDFDDKHGHLRRRSPSQSKPSDRMSSRTMRPMSSAEDLGAYASNMPGQPLRSDPMYLHQAPYASHNVGKGSTGDSMNTGQYVPKYRKRSRAPAPGVCHACGNSDTPEWRRGPDGARTLCNACGLHFSKLVRRRTMEYSNAAPGTPIPPVTIAELRASTNVSAPPNVNVTGAEDPSVPARSRTSSSMYPSPAALGAQRPVPVDPMTDMNTSPASLSVAPPPPPAPPALEHPQGESRNEVASVEGPTKRLPAETETPSANKQPRTDH